MVYRSANIRYIDGVRVKITIRMIIVLEALVVGTPQFVAFMEMFI